MHASPPLHRRLSTSVRIGACAGVILLLLLARAGAQLRDYFSAPQTTTAAASEADPLPIRRIQIPAERMLAELERMRQGTLIHLSREDFEAQVKRAREAGDVLKTPPRLLEARYRAVQDGNSLTGSAQWTILNPAKQAGVLSVQPLTVALRGARLDGKDAILGDLDGKALGLLVPEPGKHVLTSDWSARGETGPAGVRFHMELPPCALTSIELELPADVELVALLDRVTCLLTGPKPATLGNRRLWRLECPEPSPVELLIRPAGGAGQAAPVVLASLRSRLDLRPNPRTGQFAVDFDVNLDVLHGSIREVLCECDPVLRPVSVRMRNLDLETWQLQPGKTPGAPSILKIRFLEPLQGRAPTLRINCQAAVAPDQLWHAPGIHVVGAIPRGESLSIQVPAEFELQDFSSGNFELRKTATAADGSQTLSLRSGLRDPGATQRPSAVLKLQAAEVKVRALTWWQVRKETNLLTAQFSYEVSRGQVFHLPVTFPAGWQVERVEMNPPSFLRSWSVAGSDKGTGVLQVELENPLRAASAARLTLELRAASSRNEGTGESVLAFPVVAPGNVRLWEGALAISIDPSLHAVVNTPAPAGTPPNLRESGAVEAATSAPDLSGVAGPPLSLSAWTSQPPNYYYTHRAQPVTGTLQVRPRPARFHAHCETDVTIGPDRAHVQTRLLLAPIVGSMETIDVAVSAPVETQWRWQSQGVSNSVRALVRLPLVEEMPRLLALGAGSSVAAATLLSLPAAQTSAWRLTLAHPLHEPLKLETTIDLNHKQAAAAGLEPSWKIPLVAVLSAERMTGEVRLYLAGMDRVETNATGLQETRSQATAGGLVPWRSFSYGHGPVSLSLSGQPASAERTARARAGQVELATFVDAGGRLLNQYRFEVQNWPQKLLPVKLPVHIRLLAAWVDGHRLAEIETSSDAGGNAQIELPVAAGMSSHHFELIYEMQTPPWLLWTRIESPAPALPLPVEAFRRNWWLSPGLAPLQESRLQCLPGQASGLSSIRPQDFWSVWQPLAGDGSEDSLLVTRPAAFSGACWAFAITFLVVASRLRNRNGGWRYGLLLVWLASGGFGVLWLPAAVQAFVWPPLLAGLVVACSWYLWIAIRATNRFVPKARAATGSVMLALALSLALPGQAAAPTSYHVLLLPDGGGRLNQGSVLAPPELLEQLRILARRGVEGLGGAVFVSADYEGSVSEGRAVLKAAFKVYSFSEEVASLSVPVAGVEIQEALLDGAPAYLISQAPPLTGYSLRLRGRGMHKLELRFAVPVVESTASRELRCTIPEIEQSRLSLGMAAGATFVQSVSGRGAQRFNTEAGRVLLEADLGRANTLQVRWRRDSSPSAESLQVDEIHLWDLRSAGNTLHSVLHYTVLQGAPTILKIALPPNMEISQIRAAPAALISPAPRLKNWHVTADPQRQLEIEFQTPVTASVQIYLDLVSRLALAPSAALALPVPLNATPGTANSFLGCRVEGRKADPVEFNRLTGIQTEEFNVLWQALNVEDRGAAADRAYSFRRTAAGAPVLRLQLQSPQPRLNCSQNLTWRVSANHATLHATAKLDAPNDEISLLEWQVPAQVVVTSVDGPDIRSWSRSSARIQVWFRKSLKETSITMTGWLTDPKKADNLLRLPCLYIVGAAPQWTTLRVLADSDVAVEPRELQNIREVPALRPSARDRSYLSQESNYTAVFEVKPALGRRDVRALTIAEIQDRAFTFATTIDFNVREGELRTLTVRLRNWTGIQPRLAAPGVNARHEVQVDASTRVWFLEMQPGVTGHYALTLTGILPLDTATEILMPEVSVDEAVGAERLLATAGADLVAEDTRGLQALADTTGALHAWPKERDHLKTVGGSVWKVAAEDWKLRLHPRSPRVDVRPVRIVHEEYAAAVRDGQRWEYHGAYWLYQETGTDIEIVVPSRARLGRVTLDNADVTPGETGDGKRWVALSGGTGVRVLNVCWTNDGEALERPAFGRPRLRDSSGAPPAPAKRSELTLNPLGRGGKKNAVTTGDQNGVFWIIQIPAGYRAVRQDAVPESAATYELNRAAALLGCTNDLALRAGDKTDGTPKQQLAAVQELFYRSCRFAQHRLNLPGARRENRAPSALLAALLQSNRQLAEVHHFEPARAEAETHANLHPLLRDDSGLSSIFSPTADSDEFGVATGIPTYWQIDYGLAGSALRFVADRLEQLHRALALSSVILLLSLSAWLVTYSPRVVSAIQLLWPEQLVVLGYIGWQNFGIHPAFAILIILGFACRIYWLARVATILLKRWTSTSAAL